MKKYVVIFYHFFLPPGQSPRLKQNKTRNQDRTKGKGLVVDIWESRDDRDRVSSFKRGYRGRTK
jgi:hypothetical protein